MISFRQHVVTIVAIFLALALGMLAGSACIQPRLVDQLRTQVEEQRGTVDELRGQVTDLEGRFADEQAFNDAALPHLTEGRLRVARPSIHSASKDLLTAYKSGRITWEAFETRFRKEILSNPKAIAELYRLKELSQINDVYLICYEKTYPCHRFILLDMIQNLPEIDQKEKKA